MNLDGIDKFAFELYQEILAEASIEDEEKFTEEVFVERFLDYLHEAQELENGIVCGYKSYGMKIDAFDLNSQENAIDLLVAIYDGTSPSPVPKLKKNDIDTSFKRAATFLTKSLAGYYKNIEESTDAYDLARTIYDLRNDIKRARIILITDGITGNLPGKTEKLKELEINYQIWDIERLYRFVSSGKKKEPVVIDFIGEFGLPLQCIYNQDSNGIYTTYLVIISGEILSGLYDRWGTRLLERNVRAFLQAKGNVNKGIRDTIRIEPNMFMAYNNGITVTAEGLELVDIPSGGKAIKKVYDFQIVNGGQTTASLWHTSKKHKISLSDVAIQMKLTVLNEAEKIEEIAPLISKYSNTQNKINVADFYANDSFHINLERISRTIWSPDPTGGGQQTIWFYERSRGAYDETRNRERTPARIKSWDKLHPRKQKFDKLLLAKVEQTWRLQPYIVSKGAQKNFADFMLNINSNEKGEIEITEDYFKDIVSRLIIWKTTEKIVSKQNILGYRANIVTYTISWLLFLTGHRINLVDIWKKQNISDALSETIDFLSYKVREFITATDYNVTEWCKKEQCWNKLKQNNIILPSSISRELVDTNKTTSQFLRKLPDNKEKELLTYIQGIDAKIWFSISKWGKLTKLLLPKERSLLYSIGKIISNKSTPTARQAKWAKEIYEKAIKFGFNDV